MLKDKHIFGWKAVFEHYGWNDLLKDSVLPLLLAFILLIASFFSSVSIYDLLCDLVNVGLSVVPTMVALILAAYTIMLAFIISDKMNAIKNNEKRENLIKSLNAGFAACLFFSTISIILMVVVSSISTMRISISSANLVNRVAFFLVSFFALFPITILFGIIVDIFNSGQTTLTDNT